MKPNDENQPPAPRRRYLVHLACAPGGQGGLNRYIARVRPWVARAGAMAPAQERIFMDECELISAINPLLPQGSDVRDVLEHIEAPGGFFYLLPLSGEQAVQLGWCPAA